MNRQLERLEEQMEEDLASGNISQAEFNADMRELQRDYRDAAEESARGAYERELDRW